MSGFYRMYTATATTDSGGDAEIYLGGDGTGVDGSKPLENGEVYSIVYTKGDFATGVDFTITAETSGLTVWTELNVDASKTVYPRAFVHGTDGVVSTTESETGPALVGERLKIVVANGGATKTGTFTLIVR